MSTVTFIAPVYNYSPILVPSLLLQTCGEWELLLVHDGPNETGLRAALDDLSDSRVRYIETAVRYNDWGHSLRAMALSELCAKNAGDGYVVITNGDNYYVPGFIELMRECFDAETVAVACAMAHNYWDWKVIQPALRKGSIDCGCVMAKTAAALSVGWRSREYDADWVYVADLVREYGASRFRWLDRLLFVHN